MEKGRMKATKMLTGYCLREIATGDYIQLNTGPSNATKLWKTPRGLKTSFKAATGVEFGTQKEYEIIPLIPGEPVKETIKGLDKYNKENQKLLREAFSSDEIKAYLAIEKSNNCTYSIKDSDVQMNYNKSFIGLRKGTEGGFAVTNHTLFTLCKEMGKSPMDFKKIKKDY